MADSERVVRPHHRRLAMAFPPAILATGTLAAVAVDNGPVAGFLALTTIAAMGLYVLDQA